MKIAVRLVVVVSLLGLGAALASRAAFAAEDAFIGTWVLNTAKGKVPEGTMPTSSTVVVSKASSGMYKYASDTTLAGVTGHSEITFTTDGKDYSPVTTPAPPPGSPSIVQSFERVSDTIYKTLLKVNGQAFATMLNEVSADGKTLTVTTTGVGVAAGVSATMVFDRK